jgi:hypothetical protein
MPKESIDLGSVYLLAEQVGVQDYKSENLDLLTITILSVIIESKIYDNV